MAFLLEVAIIDAGDRTIKVVHQFYGITLRECENYKAEHLAGCEYYRTAEKAGRTLETIDQISIGELPKLQDYDRDEDDDQDEDGREDEDQDEDQADEEDLWRL